MRSVVDTNVFVGAAPKRASWPAGVVRWVDRHGGLLKTPATKAQTLQVLQRPYIASKFPELAVDGGADMIATGDLDSLVLHPFQSIPGIM